MRNALASHNQLAVSAGLCEAALNEWQELDTGLLCGLTDGLALVPRRDPAPAALGHEEPTGTDRASTLARGSLGFERAQPQHFALALAYGLGQVASEPVSEPGGSGFRHTLTPLAGDLDPARSNPSFTLAQRWGGVMGRRFASCFVDRLTAQFARGEWCRLKADVVATGRAESNLVEDELSGAANAAELSLTGAVAGEDALSRLDSVQRVRVELSPGEWHEVEVLAASPDTPALLTIRAPGGAGSCRYRVLYAAWDTAPWLALPQPLAESPLHISRVALSVGGRWDGSEVRGGRSLGGELRRLEWTLDNNLTLSAVPGSGEWAGLVQRGRREQRLVLTRDMRCASLQHELEGEATFCLQLTCEGAEFAPGEPYRVELIWPRVALLACQPGAQGLRLTEEATCLPLEGADAADEATPSVIARVTNTRPRYAALA